MGRAQSEGLVLEAVLQSRSRPQHVLWSRPILGPGSGSSQSRCRLRHRLRLQIQIHIYSPQFFAAKNCENFTFYFTEAYFIHLKIRVFLFALPVLHLKRQINLFHDCSKLCFISEAEAGAAHFFQAPAPANRAAPDGFGSTTLPSALLFNLEPEPALKKTESSCSGKLLTI